MSFYRDVKPVTATMTINLAMRDINDIREIVSPRIELTVQFSGLAFCLLCTFSLFF